MPEQNEESERSGAEVGGVAGGAEKGVEEAEVKPRERKTDLRRE